MANKLAQDIEKILAEEVGEFIARAAVKKNCELIGTTPDTLTAAQVPQLVEKIAKSISFFSGKQAGPDLLGRISALGA